MRREGVVGGRGMGHGEARRGGMRCRGRAGETEVGAKRVKWNGRAGGGTEGEGWDTAEHDGAERSGGEAERKR